MSCTSPTRELLTFWLAGSLSGAEAAQVESHVASCLDCREAAIDGLALVKGFQQLHLRADEVVSAAAGDLNSPHVLVCSRCRDEVALLRTINADVTKTSGRSEGLLARMAPARWWRPIGLAALAAAAAFFAFLLVPRRPADDQTALRGGTPIVVELLPAATEAGGVPTFAWTPLATATRYRVGIFSEDGRPVWTREVEAPPVRWPDDVPRTRGAYRWRVEALNAGAVVARSRLAELEVAR